MASRAADRSVVDSFVFLVLRRFESQDFRGLTPRGRSFLLAYLCTFRLQLPGNMGKIRLVVGL
jgi:hypothetical protein